MTSPSPRKKIRLLISAAETSSDMHGAALLVALKKKLPFGVELEAFGIGGPKLKKAGLEIMVDARDLLAMGFLEIVGHLPKIIRAMKCLTREAEARKPDLAIVIDYPDFHLRLAKRLGRLEIPSVYYIPPKVWAWRTGRVRLLKERFKKLLCILPFERKFYQSRGVSVTYVGNPLCDELPLSTSRAEARAHFGILASEKVLLIMPGSRKAELKRQLRVVLDAAVEVAQTTGEKLQVLMPLPETADMASIQAEAAGWKNAKKSATLIQLRISQGDSALAMLAADAGIVKSGTSTLEAGLLGCPHVLFYKTNRISEFIFFQIIRYRGPVGLVNLIAGANGVEGPETRKPFLVEEILGKAVTPRHLSVAVLKIWNDGPARTRMIAGLKDLQAKTIGALGGKSPSEMAAQAVLDTLGVL